MGSSSRRWLNQSTHSSVANSTASKDRHGPRRWITSALSRPLIVSASALDALVLGRGRTGAPALIALGLANPVAQRLRRAADLGGNRADRGRLGGVLALVVEHHPDRTVADLRRIRGYAHGHGSILPGSGAFGKPGTVQSAMTRGSWFKRA